MTMFDTLRRVGTVHTQKGRVPTYAIRPTGHADRPARTWAPMLPARPTVIPVHGVEGGGYAEGRAVSNYMK